MIAHPNYGAWQAKWDPKDNYPDSFSREAEQIADDIPLTAETVLFTSPPWALAVDPVTSAQLDCLDMLDDDKTSLNGFGINVYRCLMRRDSDFLNRKAQFSARTTEIYHAAYYTTAPSHEVTKIAMELPIEESIMLLVLCYGGKSGEWVRCVSVSDMNKLRALSHLRLAHVHEKTKEMLGQATSLGRQVGAVAKLVSDAAETIFDGAKQSKFMEKSDSDYAALLAYFVPRFEVTMRRLLNAA